MISIIIIVYSFNIMFGINKTVLNKQTFTAL